MTYALSFRCVSPYGVDLPVIERASAVGVNARDLMRSSVVPEYISWCAAWAEHTRSEP